MFSHGSPAAPRATRTKSRGARTLALLRRARELVPLTNLGLLLIAVALVARAWAAFPPPVDPSAGAGQIFTGRADYVVQLVSVLALALALGSLAAVVIGAGLVHRAFRRYAAQGAGTVPEAPARVITFEARRGFLRLLELPAWPYFPLLEVEWSWEHPDTFAVDLSSVDGRLAENVETRSRNVTSEIVRRFVIEDGFGLARIVLRRREARIIRVLPWTGELANAPMLRSLSGGDDVPHPLGQLTGDRVDMRRYVPGDPLRLALWKVYARTGELMVRTQERAIAPSVRIVAYLPSAKGDEPPAAAARVAVEGGLLGEGWTFSADGANHPAADQEGALSLIAASRGARGTERGDAAGLASFLEAAAGSEPVRIILFVPATLGPWLERAVAAAKRYGGSMSVVVVTDRVRDEGEGGERLLERLLKIPHASDPEIEGETTPEALGEVARAFAGSGAQMIAVERPTGRTLSLGRPRDRGGPRAGGIRERAQSVA